MAPQTSPSHFLAELGGDFFFPCQVVVHAHAYFFTSFRWTVTVSLRPWALGPLTVPLWAINSGRSLDLCYPIGTMCFPGRAEVACWAGRSVVLFWPSLPFGGSPRGRFCTASSCFSSGSSNLLRRGHHYRWVGILADLCTGKLVFPMSFGVVPHLPLVWSCATFMYIKW